MWRRRTKSYVHNENSEQIPKSLLTTFEALFMQNAKQIIVEKVAKTAQNISFEAVLVRVGRLELPASCSQMCVVTFSRHSSVLFGPFLCLSSSSLELFCPACFKKPFRLLGFVWDWILCIKRCSARVEGEMTGQSPWHRGAETAPHKQRIRHFFTSSVERYLILPCRRAKNNKGIHGAIK